MLLNNRQKTTLLFVTCAFVIGWSISYALGYIFLPNLLTGTLLGAAIVFSNREYLKSRFSYILIVTVLVLSILSVAEGPGFYKFLSKTEALVFYVLGFGVVIFLVKSTQHGITIKLPQLIIICLLIIIYAFLIQRDYLSAFERTILDAKLLVYQLFLSMIVIIIMHRKTIESSETFLHSDSKPVKPKALLPYLAFAIVAVMVSLGLFFTLVVITFAGWDEMEENCGSHERYKIFDSKAAYYRPEVIDDVTKYTRLQEFIIRNRDTLFAYDDMKKRLSNSTDGDDEEDTAYYKQDCITFHDYGKGNMIKDQVPANLYGELMNIYKAFNSSNFYSVTFCKDSSIIVSISDPFEYAKNGFSINHTLEWQSQKYYESLEYDSKSLSRDTTLKNGARYAIFVDCYRATTR